MEIFVSILFYLFILSTCLCLSHCALVSNKKRYIYLIVVILSLVAGLRGLNVGFDTYYYYLSVENFIATGTQNWHYVSFSQGYGIFVRVIYSIFHNYNFLLVVVALITNFFIVERLWDFRKYGSFLIFIFAYILIVFPRTMNLTVQYFALAICFYSTRFLFKDRLSILFLCGVLLASCIHVSSLICLLFYAIKLLNVKKITLFNLATIFLGIVVLAFGFFLTYNELFETYSKYASRRGAIGLMVFVQMAVFLFTFYVLKKSQYKNTIIDISRNDDLMKLSRTDILSLISLFYLIGILVSSSSYFISNAGRISYYFSIFECVYFGIYFGNKKTDKGLKILILMWIIFYSIYCFIDQYEGTRYFPYKFFWM